MQYVLIRSISGQFARYLGALFVSASASTSTTSQPIASTLRISRSSTLNSYIRSPYKLAASNVDATEQLDFISTPGSPIFLSDFVKYRCNSQVCQYQARRAGHIGRVLAVTKDCRSSPSSPSSPSRSVVAQVQEIYTNQQLSKAVQTALQPLANTNEVFLIEDSIIFVDLAQLTLQLFNKGILVYYEYKSRVPRQRPRPDSNNYFIRRIVNSLIIKIRPVLQIAALRSKLEILQYSREYLLRTFAKLGQKVYSLLFYVFIDRFGLYRNMYRKLDTFYIILARLSFQERTRRTNVYLVIVSPYSSNIEAVVRAIRLIIRALDNGELLNIPGQEELAIVCVYTAFYIGDMPQQQENSRIKSQNTTYSCRSYIIYKDQRTDLQYDIIQYRRFYYENERQRRYINSLSTQKARDDYSVRQGIDVGIVLLQLISLALDIIVIRLTDPAHSEYSGILQLLYKLLLNAILKLAALVKYTRILRGFQFPLGQARLQSPLTYISSYSL